MGGQLRRQNEGPRLVCLTLVLCAFGTRMAIAYDFGRRERDDYTNLRGMGNLSAAPAAKLFCSYVLSRSFS